MADFAPSAARAGHEPDQPRLRGLAVGGAAVVGIVALAVAVAFVVVRGMTPERARAPLTPATIAAQSRLQSTPERDFAAFHREKETLLHQYGWVDRAHGVVRIPIEDAMALLAQQRSGKSAR